VSAAEVGEKRRCRERCARGERKAGAARGILQQEVARTTGTAAGCRAEKQRSAREGRESGFSQGPVCKTEELQGLYGKLTFPTDIEI
jgi:hypothetical protein